MKNLEFLGFPFHCITPEGKVFSLKSGRFLKTSLNSKGYVRINLWDGNSLQYFSVHRLVAMCYVNLEGNFSDYQVNHKDGNKENNHYSNLEWVTLQENVEHSMVNKLRETQKSYSDDQIHIVCRLLEEGFRNVDIAAMTGVHKSKVSMIKNGLAYQYISQEYEIKTQPKGNYISTNIILKICEGLSLGQSARTLSKKYNVGYQTVRYIKRRELHQEISKNFSW